MKAKSVGEALAALGVIASLVFVAFEIRQNTVALRAAAYQSIGLSGASTLGEVAHDRDFLENAFAKAPGEMDRVDWWQFQRHMASLARTCETLQLQVVERALPEDAMDRSLRARIRVTMEVDGEVLSERVVEAPFVGPGGR